MVLAALLLLAQATAQARVLGDVRDASTRRPLVNVTVLLTNLNVAVLTGESGRYQLSNVPAGPQHITYRLIGYAAQTLDALVPREGELEIHVALKPYPVELPPIEVSTMPVGYAGESGDRTMLDHSVSLVDMKNHPLLAEPDALRSLAGGDVAMDPESPNGVHIRGGGSDQTAYLLDGIPVFSPYHVAGTFTAWNPDAIADLDLSASSPSPGMTEVIAGVIAARTRTPGARHSIQGSVSTSQVRGTVDGPIGRGVGYLLSGRSGFVPGFSSSSDASQLGSEAGDWLGKMEAPVLGGLVRLLGYYAGNEISADAAGAGQPVNPRILRNNFSWHSFSAGAVFGRTVSGALLRFVGWTAESDASARWNGAAAILDLDASRHDVGISLTASPADRPGTLAGFRLERSRTSYVVRSDSTSLMLPDLDALTVVPTLFGQHSPALGNRVTMVLGISVSRADRRWFLSPRAQLRVQAGAGVAIKASVSRLHQFGQSLRNPESVVGLVFPPDLYLGVANPAIPVPRSDQATLGLELAPAAGVRVVLLSYVRDLHDILLVAPGEAEPFATELPARGKGSSRGATLRITLASRRFALIGNYGIQRVRIGEGSGSYAPHFAPTHLFEGGISVFPTATWSIRVGASGAEGRRTTLFTGALEWEACNLLDQGCEFGGSPHYGQDPLGGTELPTYFRVDASVRKHWHVRLAGRETMVALFGTVTNLFAGHNLLTYARTPGSGALKEVEMRPLSPLVVGFDWRF